MSTATSPPLLPAPLVVTGHLVTFDDERPRIPQGALYIDRDGVIVAVAAAADPPPAGFESASRVDTGADAVVYPGLIDLHNHIAYNCLPLWIAPSRMQPWTARDQCPKDPDYLPSITLPVNALCAANGKAVLKYVETKAVVGGVTAIQGSSKVGRPFEGWMVRNVEYETFRTGVQRVNQAVFALKDEKDFAKVKRRMDAGNAFIYHLSEGTDPVLRAEYEAMGSHGCIAPRFVGIHCTALGAEQFEDWMPRGGSIVWSPFSNLWLYGATTDVAAARARGLRICLGSDWSPSGTKSLLGELKVADLVNRSMLSGLFSDEDLCRMVTCNPADAIGWEDRVGRLRAGCCGDFVVLSSRSDDDVYRNLVLALERDVRLVAINGYPMYGEAGLMAAGAAVSPEPISVGGLDRMITLRDARIEDADMSWPEVLAALEHVREDAAGAQQAAIERAGGTDELLQMVPDKPWDNPAVDGPAVDLDVEIGPLDSLVHDDAYFDAVDRAVIHGGRLSELRGYWAR
ncbi:MAG: 5-methylthioadenosine/S-adenosylhomocysteine deaminase [Solirubrobacteraceae bacterium]|nr:5-methylthioadenosine/S-adenosylhomocysteine deaminase [Solirubrobacteraceae bacterium]